MKLEAIKKAILTARERARLLEGRAKQLAQATRSAKGLAKLAKGKLKLAKQEAKKARKAYKAAKREYADAVGASEAAANDLALLEAKIKRARRTPRQPRANGKPSQPIPTKASVAKKPAKTEVMAAVKRTSIPLPGGEPGLQAPRAPESTPSTPPTVTLPKADISKSPGGNPAN